MKWLYDYKPNNTNASIVEEDGSTIVRIEVNENSTSHSQLWDNLRLIAAAPEMLRLLERAATLLSIYHDEDERVLMDIIDLLERVKK
jgi:hypothetical protein